MNEKTEIMNETATDEKTFGFDARPVVRAHREACKAANREFDAAAELINGPLHTAQRAVHALLGQHSTEAIALSEVLEVLSREKRKVALDMATATRTEACEAAQEVFDKAIGDDPFVKFVNGDNDIDSSTANAIFETAPHTFTSLKNLALDEGWCSEFEYIAARAVEAGALPDDKVTLTRPCSLYQVPSSHNPKTGEAWEVQFRVPAFVRTTDHDGDDRDFGDILYVSGDLTYRKVAEAPVQD